MANFKSSDLKLVTIVALAILLVACNKPQDKTITVPEFLHDPALIKKTQLFCSENPTERAALPNCINSSAAANRKFMMNEFGHCYKGDTVTSHKCIDDYVQEKGLQ